jgi:hypothetical protein
MGCPQQLTVPVPARVTSISEPQLAQTYLLPASFAIHRSDHIRPELLAQFLTQQLP